MLIGNVVMWNKIKWIVADYEETSTGKLLSCDLINASVQGNMIRLSQTYPSKSTGVKSVKVIANCVEDYKG